jgi:hypothetical protein
MGHTVDPTGTKTLIYLDEGLSITMSVSGGYHYCTYK